MVIGTLTRLLNTTTKETRLKNNGIRRKHVSKKFPKGIARIITALINQSIISESQAFLMSSLLLDTVGIQRNSGDIFKKVTIRYLSIS
jgi:hypothetical protein